MRQIKEIKVHFDRFFTLFGGMKGNWIGLRLGLLVWISVVHVEAQSLDRKPLVWEQKIINIGPLMEENGLVSAEFYGLNEFATPILITEVISECGCTTVEYTKDTIYQDQIASVQVSFDPTYRGGSFSKLIYVKTSEDPEGDSLFLEGINIPFPEDISAAFSHRIGDIGLRLPVVNMGTVFTNEPKVKHVEVYNFGKQDFNLKKDQSRLPEYLKVELFPDKIPPTQRGLLSITYDGEKRNDLGYFGEEVILYMGDETETSEDTISLKLSAVVYEYFPPLPKSREDEVARLEISSSEIDLKQLSANVKISRVLSLSNKGREPLLIRKISTNCECLEVVIEKINLEPNESTHLQFTFDPKGRRGIDHKYITIFSNDPLNPVKTITIKSSIK